MRVRIIVDDVGVSEIHGMTKGRELEVKDLGTNGCVWVLGDRGDRVLLFPREYEVVKPVQNEIKESDDNE